MAARHSEAVDVGGCYVGFLVIVRCCSALHDAWLRSKHLDKTTARHAMCAKERCLHFGLICMIHNTLESFLKTAKFIFGI
jgi:hypothetical protein